jgi:hypothetical protein
MLRSIGSLAASACLASALVGCETSTGSRVRGSTTLIVLDRSIGGVALRERRSDVERLLGPGDVVQTSDQKPPEPPFHIEDVLYPNGLEVTYVSRERSSRAQGRVFRLVTSSPGFRTSQGVRVGSTAAELRSIKGVTCGNLLNLDCQHSGRRHNQPSTFFRLSGPNGRILRIAIGYAD